VTGDPWRPDFWHFPHSLTFALRPGYAGQPHRQQL